MARRKSGPASRFQKPGMQDAHGLPVQGAEQVAAQALVPPDRLQQALGRLRRVAFAQQPARLLLRAPLGVKIGAGRGHRRISGVGPALHRAEVMANGLPGGGGQSQETRRDGS